VRRSLHHVLDRRTRLVLILAGDHLYRMNYGAFVKRHDESHADLTISVCPVSPEHASMFGLLHCDAKGFVTRFAEKPTGEALEAMRVDPDKRIGGQVAGAPFLASMGIYVFSPHVLRELLARYPDQNDFGKDLIPRAMESYRVAVHFFQGYWEDIGTIHSFYRANVALAKEGQFALYDPRLPALHPPALPVADAHPRGADRGPRSSPRAASSARRASSARWSASARASATGVELDGALVMGNDRYETETDREASLARGIPPLGIGDDTIVRRAILDKDVRVGRNVQIVNERNLTEHDGPNFYVRDGIVIVPKLAVVPDHSVI
jgi:glucose-1-phosphate adenylyltransferase